MIREQVKFELGVLGKAAIAVTHLNFMDFESNENTFSGYQYDERNYAGYTQLSGGVKKANYFIGLRAENTNAKGAYKYSGIRIIDKNYTNWFPKVKLGIPIDSTKTVSFNYGRSIVRPNYSSTSQIAVYINPYLVFSRNLDLNPTFLDELSANFQFKNKSVSFRVYRSTGPVYYSPQQDTTNNFLIFKPVNYKKESGLTLDATIPLEYKQWSAVNTASLILNKIEEPDAIVPLAKPYLYFYSNHTLRLPQNFLFSLTAWGMTSRSEGAFERNALVTMDVALNRKFFKAFDCSIGMNDIFRQLNFAKIS